MRTLAVLLAVGAIALGFFLGIRHGSELLGPSPPPPPPAAPRRSPARTGRAEASRESSPPPSHSVQEARARPSPSPAELGLIRSSLDEWIGGLPEKPAPLSSPPSGASDAATPLDLLAAEWDIKKHLLDRLDALGSRPLPAMLQKVTLENGKVLWARSSTKAERGTQLVLIPGVRVTFGEAEISRVQTVPSSEYLRASMADYHKELQGLDHSDPTALELALSHARVHRDRKEANRLFADWLASTGPERMIRSLPRTERNRLSNGLQALRASEHGLAHAGAASRSEPRESATKRGRSHTGETAGPAHVRAETPTSLRDLDQKIRDVRTKLRDDRYGPDDRKALAQNLMAWEYWLESSKKRGDEDPDEVRTLERELQFLRHDLLKTSGF